MSQSIDGRIAELVQQAGAGNLVRVTKQVVELLLQSDIAHAMACRLVWWESIRRTETV